MKPADQPPARGPLPEIDSLLIDRNRDGFPDDIVGMFAVPEDLDTPTWESLLNLAARLGLHSSGFTPPLVYREPQIGRLSITVRPGDADRLNALAMGQQVADEPSVLSSETEESVDLIDPWSISGLLADCDGDQAADDTAVHIELPDYVPFDLGAALVELAARIGVECGSLIIPIAGDSGPSWRRTLRVEVSDSAEATLRKQDDGNLTFSGSPESLAAGIRELASTSPGFLPNRRVHDAVEWLRRSATGWVSDGKVAQLRTALEQRRPNRVMLLETSDDIRQRLETLINQSIPGTPVDLPLQRETVVFDHQWTAEWEVTRLETTLQQEIFPELVPEQPVDVIAMVSEPPTVRRRLRGQLSRWMLDNGFNEGSLHVLDAFKPGLGWLQEIILPELRSLESLAHIEIQARRWDPEQHEGQLDMPIRWLQELFPGDEILAGELGLPLKQVTIGLSDELDAIYRVVARDEHGTTLLERSFSPFWRRIDYLAGFRDAGNVTVTTGGIIARQNEDEHRSRVLTDPEVFWRYIQGELLPNLRRFILTETGGEPRSGDQPFFDDLYVDVRISGSDYSYGIREERHSAAEALHEDIYFNVLDYIEELGHQTTGEKLSAPGSVRPFVTVTPGRQPEARIRLTRRPSGIARFLHKDRVDVIRPATKQLIDIPEVRALGFSSKTLSIYVDQSSTLEQLQPFLKALAAEHPATHAATVLKIALPTETVEIGVPDQQIPQVTASSAEGPIPDDTIISNDELFPHLNRLAQYPTVTLVPTAETSWQGRAIPAVAVTSPQGAKIWSMRKLSHFKPTKLIVARHHANEVASTTSVLQMIDALVGEESGEMMLRGLNVVFLPLENPDGAALHDELRKVNPTWKHHPARYNATGYEFSEDQDNPDSPYGEGRIRDRVWHACLPDIVVDNHGVPSHEWAQLFAGFGSPPRFGVSYWQVQALLYGILPWHDDPAHRAARDAVRDAVATAAAKDEEILHLNRVYTERYLTWGHQWVPERFPLELIHEMLFHINQIDPESPRGQRSYAVRYPKTTVLNWVTEVCDETVEGEELRRTARAHLLANKAVMEMLRAHAERTKTSLEPTRSGVRIRTARPRPIQIRPS
jgi:hypothetical protein